MVINGEVLHFPSNQDVEPVGESTYQKKSKYFPTLLCAFIQAHMAKSVIVIIHKIHPLSIDPVNFGGDSISADSLLISEILHQGFGLKKSTLIFN